MNGIDIILLGILDPGPDTRFYQGIHYAAGRLWLPWYWVFMPPFISLITLGRILETRISMDPVIIRWLSFGILFTLVVLAVHFLGKLVEKLAKITTLSFLNRIAGALFSGIKGIFIMAVLVTMLNVLDQKIHILPAEKTGEIHFL